MSEDIPRSCRARTTGDGRRIRFQCGHTGCKAANNLFNIRDFRIIRDTVWKSVQTQFSNLDTLSMGSVHFATCTNISLIFSSIVLARNPVPSRSGREQSREPKFKEEASKRESGTSVPSLERAMETGGKQQNLVVDTGTRRARERVKHLARSKPKWLLSQNGRERRVLFLGTPSTKAKAACRQGVVISVCVQSEVTYFCLSFCNSFSCEPYHNLD